MFKFNVGTIIRLTNGTVEAKVEMVAGGNYYLKVTKEIEGWNKGHEFILDVEFTHNNFIKIYKRTHLPAWF